MPKNESGSPFGVAIWPNGMKSRSMWHDFMIFGLIWRPQMPHRTYVRKSTDPKFGRGFDPDTTFANVKFTTTAEMVAMVILSMAQSVFGFRSR